MSFFGPVIEQHPANCPNGHLLGAGTMIVGWLPCVCAGGSGHRCWTCVACGATSFAPDHDIEAEIAVTDRGR
jgi:hypothetical protein